MAVWAVQCRGEGLAPTRISQEVFETHTKEDMSSTAGGPRFTDQGAISEGWIVSAQMEQDFVDNLDG